MQTEKLVSALIGIGVGMIVGTLIAPDKGSKTRREISEKGKDYLKELNSSIEGLQQDMKEKKGKVKEGMQELKEKEEKIASE